MPQIEDKHLQRFKQLLEKAQTTLLATQELLTSLIGNETISDNLKDLNNQETIIYGSFDGQNMVASEAG
ncbi:hypothetical protein [Candidatus Poriferisocius sp.]|uniref:hypothetical protein n=1 Tax=Candidatus Poriferisocius sp. TaxID=3101276 RepID=UPI003B02C196